MPTTGLLSTRDPVEPKKPASPKEKIPPSAASSKYPRPSGVGAMPTTLWLRGVLAMFPYETASPKDSTAPALETTQYPFPSGVAAMPNHFGAAPPTGSACGTVETTNHPVMPSAATASTTLSSGASSAPRPAVPSVPCESVHPPPHVLWGMAAQPVAEPSVRQRFPSRVPRVGLDAYEQPSEVVRLMQPGKYYVLTPDPPSLSKCKDPC